MTSPNFLLSECMVNKQIYQCHFMFCDFFTSKVEMENNKAYCKPDTIYDDCVNDSIYDRVYK